MTQHERRPSMWAQNLVLLVAMIGVMGSIVVTFISDRLRDEDQRVAERLDDEDQRVAERLRDEEQTVALRRVAYDQFAAAVYEYDDALANYNFATFLYVDAVLRYRERPDDPEARADFQQRRSEQASANDTAREQRTEVMKAQNHLGLIGSSDAIGAASTLLLASNERLYALSRLQSLLVTPDVLQWEPPRKVIRFHASQAEDPALVGTYDDALSRYIQITQTDVRPRD